MQERRRVDFGVRAEQRARRQQRLDVAVGAAREQGRRGFAMPAHYRGHQGGHVVVLRRVDRRACVERGSHRLVVAACGRRTQSARLVAWSGLERDREKEGGGRQRERGCSRRAPGGCMSGEGGFAHGRTLWQPEAAC